MGDKGVGGGKDDTSASGRNNYMMVVEFTEIRSTGGRGTQRKVTGSGCGYSEPFATSKKRHLGYW